MDLNQPPEQRGRARLWLAITLVVVLTGVGIWLVPDDRPSPVAPIRAPAAPASAPAPAPAPAAPATQPAPAASRPAVTRPAGPEGHAARQWLERHPEADPAALQAQARRLQAQGLSGDAWLLYFRAARLGSAPAALALAEQADPAYWKAQTSVYDAPDLIQAHKWYRLAARNGSAEAPARLQALEARLAERARKGDERAALLLQEWKRQ